MKGFLHFGSGNSDLCMQLGMMDEWRYCEIVPQSMLLLSESNWLKRGWWSSIAADELMNDEW